MIESNQTHYPLEIPMLKGKVLRSLKGSKLDFITDENQRKRGLKAEKVVNITSFAPKTRGEAWLTYVTVKDEPLVQLSDKVGRHFTRTLFLPYVSNDPDELPGLSHVNFCTFAQTWGIKPDHLLHLILSNAPKKHLGKQACA